jgi:hypothetical protein
MYMQGSPVEIQIPAHWNLIGRSMTAPTAVLSPATFVSLRLYSRKENFGALFEKLWFQFLFHF